MTVIVVREAVVGCGLLRTDPSSLSVAVARDLTRTRLKLPHGQHLALPDIKGDIVGEVCFVTLT